jgi:hypothetical protein
VKTVGGEAVGGEAAAAVPWVWQGSGGRCLRGGVGVVRTRLVRGSDRAVDGWAQRF